MEEKNKKAVKTNKTTEEPRKVGRPRKNIESQTKTNTKTSNTKKVEDKKETKKKTVIDKPKTTQASASKSKETKVVKAETEKPKTTKPKTTKSATPRKKLIEAPSEEIEEKEPIKPKRIIIEKSEKEEVKDSFSLLEVIVIVVITAIIVSISTGVIVYKNIDVKEDYEDNSGFFSEFEDAFKKLLKNPTRDIDDKELINAAIEGMYNYTGDPYTSYLDSKDASDLDERLDGEYDGIGVEITSCDEGTLIVTVFDDSPASEAGLEPGDILVMVDNKDITNSDTEEVAQMIKNSNKDQIEVRVLRAGITIHATLKIKHIYIPSVKRENFDGVGYVRITTFSNTTYEQMKKAIDELEASGIKSLIIDVRDNGGGYLDTAVNIAEMFLEKGKNIYGLETKDGTVTYYEDETKASKNYKVEVLINGGSASASEILAATLKESYGATLIGTKSYGKGTVQEKQNLSSGGMIKYTTAYWLTPNGNKIDGVGINPDIEVTGTYADGMPYEDDVQLNEAINRLR